MRARHRAGWTPPQKHAARPGSWSIATAGRGQNQEPLTQPGSVMSQGCSWPWDRGAKILLFLAQSPWVKPEQPLNSSLLPSSPQLLGHWVYIMGSSRYPPHLAEMKALKHAVFSFYPGSHKDELNVTEIMRM